MDGALLVRELIIGKLRNSRFNIIGITGLAAGSCRAADDGCSGTDGSQQSARLDIAPRSVTRRSQNDSAGMAERYFHRAEMKTGKPWLSRRIFNFRFYCPAKYVASMRCGDLLLRQTLSRFQSVITVIFLYFYYLLFLLVCVLFYYLLLLLDVFFFLLFVVVIVLIVFFILYCFYSSSTKALCVPTLKNLYLSAGYINLGTQSKAQETASRYL